MGQVFFFGDSIATGFLDEQGGWVNRLIGPMMSPPNRPTSFECTPYNLSVPGHTSVDTQARLRSEIMSRQDPDTPPEPIQIIFALGTNDAIYLVDEKRPLYTSQEFKENFLSLITTAQEFTNSISCIGLLPVNESLVNPIPWSPQEAYLNAMLKEFDTIISELCKIKELPFLPLFNEAAAIRNWNDYLHDGVHPNTRGHAWIAARAQKFLIHADFIAFHTTNGEE